MGFEWGVVGIISGFFLILVVYIGVRVVGLAWFKSKYQAAKEHNKEIV